MKQRLIYLLVLGLFALSSAPCALGQYDVVEPTLDPSEAEGIEKKEPGFLHRTEKDNPVDQLAYAKRLEKDKGHARKVRNAYRDLVHAWHESPQAVKAQLRYSELLEAAGKYEKAFKEYQYLIHYFAGRFDYQAVVDRQYRIANLLIKRKRMRFLFGGFTDKEAALPLFEQVLENAPGGEHAVNARYQTGLINLDIGELDAAVQAFDSLLSMPALDRQRRLDVSHRRAMALARLALKHRRNAKRLDDAIRALTSFTAAYPTAGEMTREAEEALQTCRARKEKLLFERAQYYDEIERNPKAALIEYEAFIRECPWSKKVDHAMRRTKVLRKQLEKHDDEY